MVNFEKRPLCRHCRTAPVNRPRGMCWTCYYRPGIRELYPVNAQFAARGVADTYATKPLPPHPTTAYPGSVEKLRVLEERAAGGFALHHPRDFRVSGMTGPNPDWTPPIVSLAGVDWIDYGDTYVASTGGGMV